MRRLYGAPRRRRGPLLRAARCRRRGQEDHHHRRPGQRRGPEQGAEGLARPRGPAVRLLPVGHDHGGGGAPEGEAEADRRRDRREYPTPGQSVKRKRAWGDFSTGGSRGIRDSHQYVREGGATARIMLIQAAANAWNVPASECSASNSVITHKPSGRKTTYGKVAEAAAKLTQPEKPTLKDPTEWKLIGKSVKRLDTIDKLTGKQVYGFDLKLPGMLNAAIKDCPVFGGKVKSYEAAKVTGMPGVRHVVKVGDSAVAVVADTWWQAKTALDALPIVWDEGENAKVSSASIAAMLKEGLDADQAFVANQNGDVKAAIAGSAKKIEAVYAYPFQNHAPMEPMNATAKYTPDRCEVWVPTQNGEAAFAATTAASGLPADKCDVYKINLGGGFGRRGAFHDYVTQAVLIAKQVPGTPVKLLWTREEDMTQGRYHPVMQSKLVGALDASGNLTGLHMRLSGQSIIAAVFPQNLQDGRDNLAFQGLDPSGDFAFGSYVAACAEISVTGGDKIKVRRIVCATDPGYAVNPAQIERQIAGSFVYGLSALFLEECTVKDGRIEQTNFHTFDSMRIAQMPKVESIIMPSGGFWRGVGEPTICVAAPAVLNAFFAATGKRIRTVPLKNSGITMV